jgi:hypothetical protein
MGVEDSVSAVSIRPADGAAPVGVPAGTVVMVTSVNRLKAMARTSLRTLRHPPRTPS